MLRRLRSRWFQSFDIFVHCDGHLPCVMSCKGRPDVRQWTITDDSCWARLGTALRTLLIDHRFPANFGFENKFNRFADRAVAADGSCRIVRGLSYFREILWSVLPLHELGFSRVKARPPRRQPGRSERQLR